MRCISSARREVLLVIFNITLYFSYLCDVDDIADRGSDFRHIEATLFLVVCHIWVVSLILKSTTVTYVLKCL